MGYGANGAHFPNAAALVEQGLEWEDGLAMPPHQNMEEDLAQELRSKQEDAPARLVSLNQVWKYNGQILDIRMYSILLLACYRNHIYVLTILAAACVDRYPPNVPCKGTFSCINLAKRRACNKRFSQALPKWCSAKVNIRYRNQLVKNYCRKSCKLCRG